MRMKRKHENNKNNNNNKTKKKHPGFLIIIIRLQTIAFQKGCGGLLMSGIEKNQNPVFCCCCSFVNRIKEKVARE